MSIYCSDTWKGNISNMLAEPTGVTLNQPTLDHDVFLTYTLPVGL